MTDLARGSDSLRREAVTPERPRRRRESGSRETPQLDATGRKRRDEILFRFFVVQIIGVTVFQKIGLGVSSELVVPLVLPLMLAGIVLVALLVRPIFDPIRLALYGGWVVLATLSIFVQTQAFSGGSVILFLLLYLPLLVSFPMSEANHRRCMDFFSTLMVVGAGIVIAQHVAQIVYSWTLWPNLDALLPASMLIPGYVYIQPIEWSGALMKPNGVFFLEVSFLSQYLTLAIAVELLLFRRLWRVLLFAGVLMSTFAGTGLLLLLLTLPVMLRRMSMRNMTIIIVALVVVGLLAYELGWVDTVAHRFSEFKQRGSSANFRFIEPFLRIVQFTGGPDALYTGIGPGHIEKTIGYQWWPVTKVVIEYGWLTGVAFYAFYFYAMFRKPPVRELAFTLVVWFSIEGALLTSVNVITCAILSSLFVIDAEPRARRRRSRSREQRQETVPSAAGAPLPAAT